MEAEIGGVTVRGNVEEVLCLMRGMKQEKEIKQESPVAVKRAFSHKNKNRRPANACQRWTNTQRNELTLLRRSGRNAKEIGKQMGRSTPAIHNMLIRLNLE